MSTISPIERRPSKRVTIGDVAIGDGASVSVQTMTKTDTRDLEATVRQINEVATLGCDIVRIAVPDEEAALALASIRKQVTVPLIADIHFDHRLAIMSVEAGVDGLRINPGNIGGKEKIKEVVEAIRPRNIPVRIGINSGSLEKDILASHGTATAEALVESAMRNVRMLEELDYHEIKISVKASSVMKTVKAYRLLAKETDYPLHLGVTEAGTFMAGTIKSSAALGILLAEGIGDTIRVSLTDSPAKEVRVGLELLRSLGLREKGPSVISCPTCGRVQVDIAAAANRIEEELEKFYLEFPDSPRPTVAVMGCMVNGPGEAREADIALAGGKDKFALYVNGLQKAVIAQIDAVAAVLDEVKKWQSNG